ncbi:nucleotide exchange factor GrpE [Pararhizobium sp. IMCC21322]|uniref:nucleotide exchange factor GrpE n=1 Tax=Pararhizobium sp. IMCC21322 TaxID=3067903 RepID=UPI0027423BBC|nr:nucleotide exchange factor GrpE [Pararhizobium sp. IMCC21322]
MSDETKKADPLKNEADDSELSNTEASEEGSSEEQEDETPTGKRTPEEVIDALLEENQSLRDEKEALRDQMLRVAADMENLRRRTQREVADSRQYAISNFARDVLSIGDNLDRAISTVSEEEKETAGTTLAALVEGVEMTGREMVRVFAKHGVTKEEPEGEKFDPNRHQAVFEVPNPSVASGMVVQVMQAGYMLGDRVLRPAMVGVSKGGPKSGPKAVPDDESDVED